MTWSTSDVAVCCSSASVRSVRALAQFVEQPRVLDGDDGLSGEVRDQCDLLVGEGTNLLADNDERADQFVLLQHRDGQKRPYAPKFDGRNDIRIALFDVACVRRKIGDVNHRLCRHHATEQDVSDSGRNGERLRASAKAGGVLCVADEVQGVAVPTVDISELGVADADRILQHGRKHWLKIAGRAADDLKHLRRGRLLLQAGLRCAVR